LTDRLSFWIAVAAVIPCGLAVFITGFSPGILLAVPLGALHVPAVLATLLLGRAMWRLLRKRSWALKLGDREVLGGIGGFAVPILFLVAWTVARESGVVGANTCRTSAGSTRTTVTNAWRSEAPESALPRSGLAVRAPAGALGDAFAGQLRGGWITADNSRLYGSVTLACEPPFAGWPLYKSATMKCRAEARLQLRSDAAPDAARGSTIEMDVDGTWTMVGLASRRDFQEWLGRELGEDARKVIDEAVRKAK
jgi:hypothetical protein